MIEFKFFCIYFLYSINRFAWGIRHLMGIIYSTKFTCPMGIQIYIILVQKILVRIFANDVTDVAYFRKSSLAISIS